MNFELETLNLEPVPQRSEHNLALGGKPLRGFWYVALAGDELARGKMRRVVLLDTPLLVGRDNAGGVFALDDHCPHRGIPLTDGSFDGNLVTCVYHGWKFDGAGVCREIPSLTPDSKVNPERITTPRFQCREEDKFIWVYLPYSRADRDQPATEIPALPIFSAPYNTGVITRALKCNIDHGIVGLMDPAHGPFVHRTWWWRSGTSIHDKKKTFEPLPNGFRMRAHKPSTNSAIYKLLNVYNEPVTTTIDFTLPNVRTEIVRCGKHWFSSRTTVTPLNDTECRLDFVAAWNIFRRLPFLTKPAFRILGSQFVGQDQRIMERQAVGLKDNPRLMLIDDADTQAKWYYKLKTAYAAAQSRGETNITVAAMPEAVTLRWRS